MRPWRRSDVNRATATAQAVQQRQTVGNKAYAHIYARIHGERCVEITIGDGDGALCESESHEKEAVKGGCSALTRESSPSYVCGEPEFHVCAVPLLQTDTKRAKAKDALWIHFEPEREEKRGRKLQARLPRSAHHHHHHHQPGNSMEQRINPLHK